MNSTIPYEGAFWGFLGGGVILLTIMFVGVIFLDVVLLLFGIFDTPLQGQ